MPRYHVNPASGQPNICRARYSHCPFGNLVKDHYDSKDEARAGYEAKMKKKEVLEAKKRSPLKTPVKGEGVVEAVKRPITIAPTRSKYPDYWSDNLIEATDMELTDYYENTYTNLESVDSAKAVELMVGLPRSEWDEDLEELYAANEEAWSNVYSWDVEYGYYQEDPIVSAPAGMRESIQDLYWTKPNAVDNYGALEHLRGKGFDTTNQRPIDAVKAYLREENQLALPWVENANTVTSHKVKFSDLRVNTKFYDSTNAQPLTPTTSVKNYVGIVHFSEKDGYKLLDGYSQLKDAKLKNEDSGDFLVIYK